MRKTNSLVPAILVALLLAFAGSMYGQAAANEQIRFQGRLLDNASTPITVSTSVDFNIYATPTGTTVLWTENHTVTPSGAGIFTVLLGSVTDFPASVDFGQPLYIGVKVSTDAEMTPRYLLSASSVSHYAKTAGSVAATDISDGNLTLATGNISLTSGTFTGDGSGLTGLPASQLTGTLPTSALTGTYTIDINGNATTASSFSGSLVGDVTGTQGATTVATVGGVTAANIAGGATLANNATAAGTALAIVRRDANGGFSAGPVTISGTGPTGLTVNSPAVLNAPLTGNSTLNLPNAPLFLGAANSAAGGLLILHDRSTATAFVGNLMSQSPLSGNQTWMLPDQSGTVALTSDLSSGTLSGSFTSLNVTGAGNFGGLLSANGGFNASVTTTAAPTTAFVGGVIESFTNGSNGFGALGEVTFTGTTPGNFQIIGTHGLAHIANPGAGLLAIGTGGQATETQVGDNVGVHAWAMDGARNSGLFAVANATYNEQLIWSTTTLAATGLTSAAVLGYNNGVTANDYGIYVEAPNNRIVGNLSVSGTITGAVTGTASNASQFNGQSAAFYLARANHTGALPDAAFTGTYTSAITLSNAANTFTGNGAGLTSVNAAQLGGLTAGEFLRHNGSVAMTGSLNLGSNAIIGAGNINSTGNFFTTGNVTGQYAFSDESFLGGGGTDGRLNVRDGSGTNRAFLQATGGGGSMELIDNAGMQQVLATSGGLLRVGPPSSGGTTNGFIQLNDAAGVAQITVDAATGNFTTANGNIRTTNGNLLSINGELQLGGVTAISNARAGSLTSLNLNGGNLTNGGSITATSFVGDGSSLTGIVASNANALGGVSAGEYLLRTGSVAMTGTLDAGAGIDVSGGRLVLGSSVTIDLTASLLPIDPTVAVNYITNAVNPLDFSSSPGMTGQVLLVVNQDPSNTLTLNAVPGAPTVGANDGCFFVYDGTTWRRVAP